MKWNKEYHIWEYEVGDKVQIKPLSWMIDHEDVYVDGGCYINNRMTMLAGKIETIHSVDRAGNPLQTTYRLVDEDWWWTTSMLLPYSKKKRKIKLHKATIKALQLYENMRRLGFESKAIHELVQEVKKTPDVHPKRILNRMTTRCDDYCDMFVALMCGQEPYCGRPADKWELMLNRKFE